MRHQGCHHITPVARWRGGAALAAAAGLLLAGCSTAVYPPVAAGGSGDSAFKARVADLYGPGTPARRLRADLAAEGFTLVEDPERGRASALFGAENLPCYSRVRIDWTEDARGLVREIQAQRADCT